MDTRGFALDLDIEIALHTDGIVVLADLVALGQIGIEVVFAVELGVRVDLAVQGESGANDMFDRLLVRNRQAAWHTEADRAAAGVRLPSELVFTAAEHFAFGQ